MPPSPLLRLLSVPLGTVRLAVVKPVTASLKVKVTVAVSPIFSEVSLMVILDCRAGALVSTTTLSAEEATLTLPAASVAFRVTLCVPADKALEATDQLPAASAVVVPRMVLPPVSNRLTVA